ncbi:MAG TPA: hypothetical protein VK629_20490 [Steroidobacteraceae bacterium]|nr:hypothetical protein [Steroidobacteraceae bacterium]
MRIVVLVLGVIGVLLGGLWLLQGIGVVHLKPILCFANCAPVQEPSTTWAIAGFVLLMAGAFGISRFLRRGARH